MNEIKEKDILFQFLESLYENNADNSAVKKIEQKLFEKLNCINSEKSISTPDFETITDLIHELCCEIKYRYFICGSLAGNIIGEFSR